MSSSCRSDDRHVVSSEPGLSGPPVEGPPGSRGEDPAAAPGASRLRQRDAVRGDLRILGCEVRPFNPLFDALPRRMLVARGATQGATLASFIELTRDQMTRSGPGRETMLARLAELMFVEALRRFIEAYPTEMGWLAGMSDELVGRSLAALHSRPGHAWTLEVLARQVATSRSVLAERFTGLLGMGPMQYLARWRMQLAAELPRRIEGQHRGDRPAPRLRLGGGARRPSSGSSASRPRTGVRGDGVRARADRVGLQRPARGPSPAGQRVLTRDDA